MPYSYRVGPMLANPHLHQFHATAQNPVEMFQVAGASPDNPSAGKRNNDGSRWTKLPSRRDCSCTSQLAGKNATLQNFSVELINRIDELREKRDGIKKSMSADEEEKENIHKDIVILKRRLSQIDDSLASKHAYVHEYEKTINEVESAYSKILESSQALLYVLNKDAIDVGGKK